ncbi:hypothetical protein SLS59_008240 [Nothophoma quercina]|uniref:Uncharacterized protein n=1 Tax=Nothophoma quercina TaxID=749835 RepID=A0ABR3QV16_9PLEO
MSDAHILSTLRAHLSPGGSTALTALASTTIALSTPTPDPQTLAHALISHTTTMQNLTNQLTHIQNLQQYLSKQHALLRAQLHELQTNPSFSAPSSLQRQTIEQTRQTKHLRSKIREAESQLSSLQSSHARAMTPGSKHIASAEAIAEMLEQQRALEELRERVEALEGEVEEFGGLPADLAAARKEVGRLEVKCDEVRRRRDELFEGLVG